MDTLLALPHALHGDVSQWPPVTQATAIAALSLITEDGATVSAGLLAASGTVGRWTAFLGAFLGIWLGDCGLYLLARWGGRPALGNRWVARQLSGCRLAACERWFARRGAWALFACRWIPGSRLPTFLAAGLLRMPFARFTLVTGLAALLWTLLLFHLSAGLGESLHPRMTPQALVSVGVAIALGSSLVAGILASRRRVIAINESPDQGALRSLVTTPVPWKPALSLRIQAAWGRWRHWEFWPSWLFYPPVALGYLLLALRHRSLTLPVAANPGIEFGGLIGESKIAILHQLAASHPDFTAQAWPIRAGDSVGRITAFDELVRSHGLSFPLILKPDQGQRGLGVRRIQDRSQAAACLAGPTTQWILQTYAPGPSEAGIFYARDPGQARGRILSITDKVFPSVRGDGVSTIEMLVWADPRARCLAERYLARLGDARHRILPANQDHRLVEIGNHAQGCIFRDGAHLWSEALEARIDSIARSLPGFFVGRFDIRYAHVDDLCSGRAFQIVELNGAAAEATHIYDRRISLVSAYRALFAQWRLVFAIGAANRARGVQPGHPISLGRVWWTTARHLAALPAGD